MGDMIAAIATGNVRSAIGVIRISGEGAVELADAVFRPINGRRMADMPPGRLTYGNLVSCSGEVIDSCMCVVFRAPHSYTGEDSAEFQCHGSPVALSEALQVLFAGGARQALPGEFTKRAFLNGKMDLIGAEAVIDLIDAQTSAQARNASAQMGGAVSRRIGQVYSRLLDMASHFDAVVDWPDEDIEEFELENYERQLTEDRDTLRTLLRTFERGRVMKDGVTCAIAGRPNVGKSSLMNAILGFDRAIVTSEPGTTRDTLEERAVISGVLVRLTDTAGIRDADSEAERQGVERARAAAGSAMLVIGVFDGSAELEDGDRETLALIRGSERAVAVINKSDLPQKLPEKELQGFSGPVIRLSARSGEGVDKLCDTIGEMFRGEPVPAGEVLTNARQAGEISRALEAIESALEALEAGAAADAVLTMTEEAMAALGALTGKNARQDVVDRIFERFCVGK